MELEQDWELRCVWLGEAQSFKVWKQNKERKEMECIMVFTLVSSFIPYK